MTAKLTASLLPKGDPGIVRAPFRFTNWSNVGIGSQFYPGDQPGDPYTDLVYSVEEASGVVLWGQCIKEVKLTASMMQTQGLNIGFPHFSNIMVSGQKCFREASRYDFLATSLFLAQEAIIKNLIAERVIAGNPQGKRVEIDPEQQAMFICDSSGNERARFSGVIKDAAALLAPTLTNWSNSGIGDKTITGTNVSKSQGWSEVSYLPIDSTGGKATVYCQLFVKSGEGLKSLPDETTQGQHSAVARVTAEVRLVNRSNTGQVYDIRSIETTSPIDWANANSDEMTNERMINVALSVAIPPGNATNVSLQYRLAIAYIGDFTGIFKNQIIATEAAVRNFAVTGGNRRSVTEYFSNGWIISSQTDDYVVAVWDESKGMTFAAQNVSGYGFRLTNNGVQVKKPGGSWQNLIS